jgi:hypothetical protein
MTNRWIHVQLILRFRLEITYYGLQVNLTPYLLSILSMLVSNTASLQIGSSKWLELIESNYYQEFQRLVCYHYTKLQSKFMLVYTLLANVSKLILTACRRSVSLPYQQPLQPFSCFCDRRGLRKRSHRRDR